MIDRLIPDSVTDSRSIGFEEINARLLQLSLESMILYDIDKVAADKLYDLADQFNVLGFRGWILADTDTKRRTLIKRSIELQRIAGTIKAIKLALDSVGYPDVTIEENPGLRYDGSALYDGSQQYAGGKLGQFIVYLDPVRSSVSLPKIELIIALINEWKNARSHLADLRIGDISLFSNLLTYDGRIRYDGVNDQRYSGELAI